MTKAAHDSTVFAPMVRTSEENLAEADAIGVGTFVTDTGYWLRSRDDRHACGGAHHPNAGGQGDRRPGRPAYPRTLKGARALSVKDGAVEMGVSYNWRMSWFFFSLLAAPDRAT